MSDAPIKVEGQEPASPADLVAKYSAAAPIGTFTISLPEGEPIHCRYPERYADLKDFEVGLAAFWNDWNDPDELPAGMEEFAPSSFSEAYAAFLLHFYSVEPTKFSGAQALAIVRNPWVGNSLKTQIEKAQRFVADGVAFGEIEAAGKGSPGTPGSGSDSGSASTSSTDTPTS